MEAAEQWLANYDEKVARAAENAQVANENLRTVTGRATSPRGEVAVRVGPSGALEDLKLTPAARVLEAGQLARLILATAQEAQRTVGAQVVEIMTDYVGEGPALEMVRRNLLSAGVNDEPAAPVDEDAYFENPPVIVR